MASATYQYLPDQIYVPKEGKYIPKTSRREENLFIEEYYCSTDTKIYIDDIDQTEIAYINYSLQEQLKPLYGYASNTFDDVAVGNRIVTGMMKVSLKNPEAQSIIDLIGGDESSTVDYNQQQEDLKNSIEWIHNNIGTNEDNKNKGQQIYDEPIGPEKPDNTEPDTNKGEQIYDEPIGPELPSNAATDRLQYLEKLKELGVIPEGPISNDFLSSAITAFQAQHGFELSEINGKLTEETRKLIDQEYQKKQSGLEQKVLAKGSTIYMDPMFHAASIEKVTKNTKVTILTENLPNNAVQIEIPSKNGVMIKGYVKKEALS